MTLAAAAKIAASVLTSDNGRKTAGWILVLILSPLILLAVIVYMLLGGGMASSNVSTVEVCFGGGAAPSDAPVEYREHIAEMQGCFAEIDSAVSSAQAMIEEDEPDSTLIKSVFFSLYFGEEYPSAVDVAAFVDCFVEYEQRTRTVTVTSEDGEEVEVEEVYTVALPIDDVLVVYDRIGTSMGVAVSEEDQINADSIYSLMKYGSTSGSGGTFIGSDVVYIGADGFVSPIGEHWRDVVTSECGTRRDPFSGKTNSHTGIDLGVPIRTPIRAALDGTVTTAKYAAGSYGYYVMIDHGEGLQTLYAHNSKLLVEVGQTVKAGDIISLSGSTGKSTGPHLHFEVRVDGAIANPRNYLP